jgi:DNA-binding transcriptional LysR family regulator
MAQGLATRLTLKHLRMIAAVAEHRQLSLAAHALSVTQPAASRTLAEIEALIGAPLFDRHARGMDPTPLGAGLALRARTIIEALADAAEEAEQLRFGRGGVVRIGAVTGAAVGIVVPVVRQLKALAPDAEVHVQVGMSEDLVNDLMALRLDMVLGRLPNSARPADFDLIPAAGEQVRLVTTATHPLALTGPVAIRDLSPLPWVMQGPGAPVRRAVEEAFVHAGASLPRDIINTSSLLVVLAMLRDSPCVTPLSHEVAELLTSQQPGLVILPLADPISVAPYALVTLRGRRLTPVAARCHGLVAELVR